MSEPNGTSKRGFPTGIVVLLGFLALVLLLGTPNFVGSGRSRIGGIINNLMQLDGAKQMWALDHGRTGAVEVTRHDVAPYLRAPPGWVQPVAGERYTLNRRTDSPEAELTQTVGGRPKGTRIRLGPWSETNSVYVIIPPTSSAAPNQPPTQR